VQIPTNLLKAFNASLTELGAEMALIALREEGFGPFEPQAYRGFSSREIQAIVRALSYPELKFTDGGGNGATAPPKIRMRMTSPSHRSLLGVPLRYHQRICGALVIGRKDTSSFPEKDRRQIDRTAEELESALAKSGLLALVPEPTASAAPIRSSARGPDRHGIPADTGPTEEVGPLGGIEQSTMEALMSELGMVIPYDRALLARYDSHSKLLVGFLSHIPGHFEWRQGHNFTLDGSAAGWVIRHKKPRLDRDLASTQGRFLDYKELYKDKFKTALVLPLRKGQNFLGTILLASRTPDRYNLDMVRAAAGILEQLTRFLPAMAASSGRTEPQPIETAANETLPGDSVRIADPFEARELLLRQERQAAIRELTEFLEQEIQRTLTKTRLELEETLGDPALAQSISEGSWQRVEQACRDLTRIEAILNEIMDHAKPLELHPRIVRVPEVINGALMVITDEIDQNLITVTRQFSDPLPPIKADESKLQQVFLSILKNALEAMSAGGHIRIAVAPHRGVRGRHEVSITIENDGAPIPTEHIGKIFEPGFTTKSAGTGLGLSSVKKIIEEHRGQISIASGPGQGTAVIIRLPAHAASRLLGRGRRRPRRRPGRP
jgi:signal transduction histidine kinase